MASLLLRSAKEVALNSKTKRRLIVVTGIIIIVMALVLAFVGSNASAKTISLSEATSGNYANQRVQVTGNVVDNSYSTSGNTLTFSIYDPDNPSAGQMVVDYQGSASSTFGNGVTAISTGRMTNDGHLEASELVTKCPSKYESGTDALTVSRMLEYGNEIENKTVKVEGIVQAGSQQPAGSDVRFVLVDTQDASASVPVHFDGALSDEASADQAKVVLTGNMDGNIFNATDVSIEG